MALSIRPGVMSMIWALPWAESVITPACDAGERLGLVAELGDRHREQGHRDPLAGGQQHVELARRRQRRHLLGEVEQLVGRVAHRRDDDDDVVARPLGVDDPLGDPLDAGRRRRPTSRRTSGRQCPRVSVLVLDADSGREPAPGTYGRAPRAVARQRPQSIEAARRPGEHLIRSGDLVGVDVDVGVEPVVGDDRQQRVEQRARRGCPRRRRRRTATTTAPRRRRRRGSGAGRSRGRRRC